MKKYIITLFVGIVYVLFGCQKTPTTITNGNIENITGEYTNNEIIEDETTEEWEDVIVVNITTKDVNETFQIRDKTITFKGTISLPDRMDGLYTYKAVKTSYDEYFDNMSFLFGAYENEAYVPTDSYTGKVRIGVKAVRGDENYYASIHNCRAENNEVLFPPSNVYYEVKWNPIVDDSEVPIYMTDEEAKKKADEIILKIGVNGFEYEKCVYSHITAFEGNEPIMDDLSVIYRQYLQGIPVVSYYGQNNQCGTFVRFVSRGVDNVSIAEYAFERVSRHSQCLTYEEALKCFKKYVDSCNYYDGAIFTDISFQYVIKEEYIDGEKIRLVIPCYKFDTLVDPALNNLFPDVFVDARNGMVYSRAYI